MLILAWPVTIAGAAVDGVSCTDRRWSREVELIQSERAGDRTSVRYEPDDKPPAALTFGLGLQLAILCLSGIVLTPAIVVRAADGSETYLAWAVFAAVAVSGVTTVLQAVRVGRIGAGYVLLMGTSGAFIAVSVTALARGGPAMLATLVVISALFQFVLAARLSLLRRVLTPTVAGTVIMLIAVTVMPIVFDTLKDEPLAKLVRQPEFVIGLPVEADGG